MDVLFVWPLMVAVYCVLLGKVSLMKKNLNQIIIFNVTTRRYIEVTAKVVIYFDKVLTHFFWGAVLLKLIGAQFGEIIISVNIDRSKGKILKSQTMIFNSKSISYPQKYGNILKA